MGSSDGCGAALWGWGAELSCTGGSLAGRDSSAGETGGVAEDCGGEIIVLSCSEGCSDIWDAGGDDGSFDAWEEGSLDAWEEGSLDAWEEGSFDVWEEGSLDVWEDGSFDGTEEVLPEEGEDASPEEPKEVTSAWAETYPETGGSVFGVSAQPKTDVSSSERTGNNRKSFFMRPSPETKVM